jgi:hypothetical protein
MVNRTQVVGRMISVVLVSHLPPRPEVAVCRVDVGVQGMEMDYRDVKEVL